MVSNPTMNPGALSPPLILNPPDLSTIIYGPGDFSTSGVRGCVIMGEVIGT